LAQQFFLEAANPPALRPAWVKRGWWDRVFAWIDATLEEVGGQRTGEKQLKTWQISSLSTLETTLGKLYFKAVPPFFAREPGLTRFLWQHFPKNSPEPVAIHPTEPWMLLRDFGDLELDKTASVDQVRAALRDYAIIQIRTSDRLEQLRALGCQDRNLLTVAADLQHLHDETTLCRDQEDGLSSREIERLQSLLPEFIERCETLHKLLIPATLEHGDLWLNNVNLRDGRAVIYDWTDGAISFPLLGIPISEFSPWEAFKESLIEAYPEPFTKYEPLKVLKAAFESVQPIIHLYRAISYQTVILPGVEATSEWNTGAMWSLKEVLNIMNRGELNQHLERQPQTTPPEVQK
jgi:hypothetical protein